jgi:DNA-binding transcriptional ArsR family regulator
LSDRLNKAQSTVSWHLSNLADAGLVTKERDGRRVIYEVTDADRVTYLYTIHRQSFTDRVVDRLLDLWEGY